MTDNGKAVNGSCGIGHTRWATHGEPSAVNAHPHSSDDANVIAVHNGIIENYQELREKLVKSGYEFKSQTDTEVAVKLVDYYYKKYNEGPVKAIARAMYRIRGSYALCVMYKDYPGEIYTARKDSPMIIGIADGETYVASDVPAILKYTRNVYYIGNLEIAKLEKGKVTFYNIDCEEITKPLTEIKWDAESAEKGGYELFMLKEIHEQPKVIKDTINSVVTNGVVHFDSVKLTDEEISYIHSEAYAAGELKHGPISLIEDGTIVISVITQDNLVEKTISNMVEVKSRGARLMAVTMAGNYFIEDTAEFTAYVPRINKLFAGSLAVVQLQLVGYYVTIAKGFDVDKPRNLAKSVTVE